jgi:hypothetical protein
MHQADYIGYRKSVGDLATSSVAFATTVATAGPRALASGGLDISADIQLLVATAALVPALLNQWTSHPAADARDFIKNAKPTIVNLDPRKRLASVISYSQKINPKAIDVNAAEWILWYKQNYSNDYLQLTPDDKKYWNDYLISLKKSYNNPNNMNVNLDKAMFSTNELNYNASPIQSASNILTSITSGKTNWILYGAIAIGAILLIKNINK